MIVQIMHRGLIPTLYKRGPIASIDLDHVMIRQLVLSGVDVRYENGDPIPVCDLPELTEAEKEHRLVDHQDVPDMMEDDTDEVEEEPTNVPTPAKPNDPYAGMSKNQIKKAKRAAAEAAAKAASQSAPVSEEKTEPHPEPTAEEAPIKALTEAKEDTTPTE